MKRTPANNSMHTDRLQRCALSATGDAGVGHQIMNERLIKQWAVTETLLQDAAAEISGTKEFEECSDFLSHNELELALDVLENAGHARKVSRAYWWNLKKAAEVMGLSERYATLREQVRLATIDAQPIIPPDAAR